LKEAAGKTGSKPTTVMSNAWRREGGREGGRKGGRGEMHTYQRTVRRKKGKDGWREKGREGRREYQSYLTPLRDLLPNAAAPDDGQRLPRQLRPHKLAPLPLPLLHRHVCTRKRTRRDRQKREGELGSRNGVAA
jgi:hypothetical protein